MVGCPVGLGGANRVSEQSNRLADIGLNPCRLIEAFRQQISRVLVGAADGDVEKAVYILDIPRDGIVREDFPYNLSL